MLQNIRDNTQGTLAKIIIVVICIPFVLFGVESLLGTGGVSSVAEINGEKITEQDLNEEIYLQKRRLIAQMGDNVDPGKLDDKKLRQPALDALIERKLLIQAANENKMSIADEQINKLISGNPDFQEDGRFSNERFKTLVGGAGLTPSTYKRLFERDLLLNQLSSGIVSTGFVTDKEIGLNTRFTHQTRDIRYITLSLEKETAQVEISPEEIRAYYDNNSNEFQTEESVIAEYIELKQSDFEDEVTEEQIKLAYDNEVAAFETSETREVSHILVSVDGDTTKEQAINRLMEIKTQFSQGKPFSELARQYSEDFGTREQGGVLGELNEDILPPSFVAAAKLLKKGEVSDVVETDSGFHLIQLTGLNVSEPPSFEERQDSLALELKTANSAPAFWAAVEEMKDVSFNSPDLEEPAKTLKIDIKESAEVKRSGGIGIFGTPSVYQPLFESAMISERRNSDVLQIKPDHAMVVRVKEHRPAKLLPFEEVSDKAKTVAIREKAKKQLAGKTEKILAELKNGSDVEKVANDNSYEWQLVLAAKRTSPEIDRDLLAAAFKLPKAIDGKRAIDSTQTSSGDAIVLVVDNVKDGKPDDFASSELSMIKSYMAQTVGAKEFKAVESYLKSTGEIEIH